jgi:hypothetical protein
MYGPWRGNEKWKVERLKRALWNRPEMQAVRARKGKRKKNTKEKKKKKKKRLL